MNALDRSYLDCVKICKGSGSNFYRSFSLLSGQRRRSMHALYAFSRIADDASDSENAKDQHWNASEWREWTNDLYDFETRQSDTPTDIGSSTKSLAAIRLALQDTVRRFAVPQAMFQRLIDGIDRDQCDHVSLANWSDVLEYCDQVASSVGEGCLAIWTPDPTVPPAKDAIVAAKACGIAFQVTNILRDLTEDSLRNRCYLATADLKRNGISPSNWEEVVRSAQRIPSGCWTSKRYPPAIPLGPSQRSRTSVSWSHAEATRAHDLERIIRIYSERAFAYYRKAWDLRPHLCPEGARMFSLMWTTYKTILQRISDAPGQVFQKRVQLSVRDKLALSTSHFLSFKYGKHVTNVEAGFASQREKMPAAIGRNAERLQVAVVGGGLAGIQASIDLAKQGVEVTLFESKARLGGRAGSFIDKESGESIDYCQHVGMNCCHQLRSWILETNQSDLWSREPALYFVASSGETIRLRSWPLPPPLHLLGVLLRWPKLSWGDRISIARSLRHLLKCQPSPTLETTLAIVWLRQTNASARSLKNFWEVIIVSALGERLDRVSLAAVRKVLVDGFANSKDSFELLVPLRPLSELVHTKSLERLTQLGVKVHLSCPVVNITSKPNGGLEVGCARSALKADGLIGGASDESVEPRPATAATFQASFDAAIVSAGWRQLSKIVSIQPEEDAELKQLRNSPITGIHSWWNRPWLSTPHAILIDKLSQWVFPGPLQTSEPSGAVQQFYYQVVISASHDLRSMSSQQVTDRVKAELAELFPESRNSELIRSKVVTDPNAVFSITPESFSSRWPTCKFEAKNLFLAGDWTQTGWPATMEGALLSGSLAAKALLESRTEMLQ